MLHFRSLSEVGTELVGLTGKCKPAVSRLVISVSWTDIDSVWRVCGQ